MMNRRQGFMMRIKSRYKKDYMQRIRIFLLTFFLVLCIFLQPAYAQMNKELIDGLNELLIWDIRLMQQCEYHSDTFDISIPYSQIIYEQEQTIRALAELIDSFGADLDDKRLEIERSKRNYQALNIDANLQIKIISMIDKLLEKFGHPKVQAHLQKAKNQALIHYMYLSNASQKIIAEDRINDILNIKQP
jgi:hypothetical protein